MIEMRSLVVPRGSAVGGLLLLANIFPQCSGWRGYERRQRNITALYEPLTTGEAQYFLPGSQARSIPR